MKSIFFATILLFGLASCRNNVEKEEKSIVPAETRATIEYNQKQLDTLPENQNSTEIFIGNGGEPFWSVKIQGDSLQFETPDQKTLARVNSVDVSGNTTNISSSFENGNIMVHLIKEKCQDGMSGMEFSHKVELKIGHQGEGDEATYSGCGSYKDL